MLTLAWLIVQPLSAHASHGPAAVLTAHTDSETTPPSAEEPPADITPEVEPGQEPGQESEPQTEPPAVAPGAMTAERLGEIIQLVDKAAVQQGNSWQFQFQQRPLFLVYDKAADRMRLMTPVASVDALDESLMFRMLQANYDAVLDPRYAVARGFVWSVFIHPLAALREEQFASAIVQVHTAANTFGTSFTSGVLVFGGGDSQEEHRRLLQELQELLNPTT